MAQKASTKPTLLQPRTAQRRLKKIVYEEHYTILSTLPLNAKLSIALDCWTSPFQQAFMAITGYFIDRDWNYRELLLGFEPLDGPHSGVNLSEVLMEIFKNHDITNRVLAITSDNASNNTTLVQAVQDSIDALDLPGSPVVVRIPCLAHVIQLSLRELLGSVKADPQNDTADRTVSNIQTQARSLHGSRSQQVIMQTLTKVSVFLSFRLNNSNTFYRFVGLLCLLTLVPSVARISSVYRPPDQSLLHCKMSARDGIRHF